MRKKKDRRKKNGIERKEKKFQRKEVAPRDEDFAYEATKITLKRKNGHERQKKKPRFFQSDSPV